MSHKTGKKPFSLGIYVEGLRRLKLPGIIVAVILSLSTLLVPLESVLDGSRAGKVIRTSLPATSLHPLLLATFIVAAPLLTAIMFSFLNKRNSSDFYHSLPHTRVCLFLSSAAAVLTWIALITASSSALSALLAVIFSKYIAVVPGTFLPYMFGCFASSVLVTGAVAMAFTLTGRPFSNFVVSGLILFFPRFLVSMMTLSVSSRLPIIAGSLFGSSNFEGMNIIYSLLMSLLQLGGTSSSMTDIISSVGPQIYTFLLGLVYLALGCVFFHLRKSETAEHPAPNRTLQAVFRIAACMTVSSFVTAMCYSEQEDIGEFILPCILGYALAVLVYFLYEIISTRKWKNLLRAAPGLGVVVLLNLVMFGAMAGIYRAELSFTPSADEIKSISIYDDSYMSYGSRYQLDIGSYVEMITGDIELDDSEALEAVSSALKSNVDVLKRGGPEAYFNYFYSKESDGVSYTFTIRTAHGSKERGVFMTREQVNAIADALDRSEEYKNAYLTIPKAEPGSLRLESGMIEDEDKLEAILDTMRDEVSSLDFKDWYYSINEGYGPGNSIDSMSMTTIYNKNAYRLGIPIMHKALPRTAELYVNTLGGQDESYLKDIESLDPMTNGIFNIQAYIWNEESGTYDFASYKNDYVYESSSYGDSTVVSVYGYNSPVLAELPKITDEGRVGWGDSFLELYVERIDENGYYEGGTFIVRLADDKRDVWEPMFISSSDGEEGGSPRTP